MAQAKASTSLKRQSLPASFDAKNWLDKFKFGNHGIRRDLRQDIMQGTLKACEEFKYLFSSGEEVSLGNFESVAQEARKTYPYVDTKVPKRGGDEEEIVTKIEVTNRDCLEEAVLLKNDGFNPAVLNMASPKRPGGGYLSGAGAQEENIFRRTNYVQHLADPEKVFDSHRKWKYRLPEFSCTYSTNVLIFRAAEPEGYAFLPQPIPMSFLAVAAYPNAPRGKDGKELIANFAKKTKWKMRNMLAVGLKQGHDSLVLSAWGCGAFRNPPRHIAQLFKEVIAEDEFVNRYKHISFAIIDDHNAQKGEGNYKPFADIFSSE